MKYLSIILLVFSALSSCKKNPATENLNPTVESFSPASAAVGTEVTIKGTNFSTSPIGNTVTFNGVPANVSESTGTQISVTVPPGATTGLITIKTASGMVSTSSSFTVTGTASTI